MDFDPLILVIPFIAALVGWFTNVVAVKMTLHPYDFVGVRPFGWQGAIPAAAEKLTTDLMKLIKGRLLNMDDVFDGLAEELGPELDSMAEKAAAAVIRELSTNIAPEKWASAHPELQKYITEVVEREVRKVIEELISKIGADIGSILDIEEVMLDAVREDSGLMSRVLLEIAGPEFDFLERSGAYFGFAFGLVQMVVWHFYPAWWILPFASFLVGAGTNYLALYLIFEPGEPVKIGPFTVQGLFIKRQKEASEAFSDVLMSRVLSAENIMKHLAEGSAQARILELMESQMTEVLDGFQKDPMAGLFISPENLPRIKADALKKIRDVDPTTDDDGLMRTIAGRASVMGAQMKEKLGELDPSSFSDILKPTFEQDEWKLVLTGAVLGLGAGVLQLFYIFGDALA